MAGSLPTILSMMGAHLLRNVGYSRQASIGLSGGGILNMVLDPLFMFVLLPDGWEVLGAALATLISNIASCIYMLYMLNKVSKTSALSIRLADVRGVKQADMKGVFTVGVPSAILTGLFDVANIFLNALMAVHGDLALAAVGISLLSLALFQAFAAPLVRIFLSTSAGDVEAALVTIGFAVIFIRIRCVASPFQFLNYHTSYCMQAMGDGFGTLLHAVVRELVFYIPFMFLLDRIAGEMVWPAPFRWARPAARRSRFSCLRSG